MAPVFRDLNSELREDSQFNYETIQIYYYLTSDIINVAHVTAFTITVFPNSESSIGQKGVGRNLVPFPSNQLLPY